MPPKRATRASSSRASPVAGSEAGSSRTHITTSTESARLRGSVVNTNTPGPARYSTSYGSPATLVARRYDVGKSTRTISGTLEEVIDSVNDANRKDAKDRAKREAAEARRKYQVDRMLRIEEEDEVRRQRDEAIAARLAEQDQVDLIQPGEQSGTWTPKGKDPQTRAASEQRQTQTTAAGLTGTGRREFSEPPGSMMTARSFFEESHLYGDATLRTPLEASRAAPKPLPSKDQLGKLFGETQTPLDQFRAPPPKPLPDLAEIPGAGKDKETQKEPQTQPAVKGPAVKGPAIQRPVGGKGKPPARAGRKETADGWGSSDPSDPSDSEEELGQKSPLIEKTSRTKASDVDKTRAGSSRQPPGTPPNKAASDHGGRAKSPTPPARREELPRQQRTPWSMGSPSLAAKNLWTKIAFAISLLVLTWIALRVVVISTAPSAAYDGYRADNRIRWYGSDWKSNIRQFVPFTLLHPLGAISDAEFNEFNRRWDSQRMEIAGLRADQGLHKATLDKLDNILPNIVHVNRDKKGKLIVADNFWHALRDLTKADKDVFTLQKGKDGTPGISDYQLLALKKQLEKVGLKADTLDGAQVEDIAGNVVPKAWASWAKDNAEKVKAILGVQDLPAVNDEQATEKVLKLIKSKLDSDEFKDTVVSKDEFIRRLKEDIMVHRSEIKGDLAALEQELARKIKAISEASSPDTMTKQEAKALVKQLVDNSIASLQLGSTSQARINAYYAENLDQHVNFFSRKTGATIIPQFTSPDFIPEKQWLGSPKWLNLKPYTGKAHNVLEAWDEHGDCWCGAGPSPSFQVELNYELIPQHIVVEHISATGTLDPGAMPKDLEVWARFEEYNMKNEMADWSATAFPNTDQDNELIGHGFTQIGEFKYENEVGRDRMQVYKVSPELAKMRAFTSSIVVRAVSNYGAQDHTCFYRVKLYGELGAMEKTEEGSEEGSEKEPQVSR